ncbi:hypothetical protein CIK05_11365 [Bdellovibrio sp. qaytius]|nr:hypothetical protein CIK05_11365 [Bdellovibrio sp. qaytius]
MKTVIVLLATMASLSASAMSSTYGKLSFSGGQYHCTVTNSGSAKTYKYVVYDMERRAGKDREVTVQQRIDLAAAAGETVTVGSGISATMIGQYCRFLSK